MRKSEGLSDGQNIPLNNPEDILENGFSGPQDVLVHVDKYLAIYVAVLLFSSLSMLFTAVILLVFYPQAIRQIFVIIGIAVFIFIASYRLIRSRIKISAIRSNKRTEAHQARILLYSNSDKNEAAKQMNKIKLEDLDEESLLSEFMIVYQIIRALFRKEIVEAKKSKENPQSAGS